MTTQPSSRYRSVPEHSEAELFARFDSMWAEDVWPTADNIKLSCGGARFLQLRNAWAAARGIPIKGKWGFNRRHRERHGNGHQGPRAKPDKPALAQPAQEKPEPEREPTLAEVGMRQLRAIERRLFAR